MRPAGPDIPPSGKLVIARTANVGYRVVRPTRSLLSYWLSGEEYLRQYRGPGKVLLVSTPYLRRPDAAEDTRPAESGTEAPRPPEITLQQGPVTVSASMASTEGSADEDRSA